LAGLDHPKVCSYIDVLLNRRVVGKRVAIIGAGGIVFDVAEYLSAPRPTAGLDISIFLEEWGIDSDYQGQGGLRQEPAAPASSGRQIWLLQRKNERVGKRLGKTTGWVHRIELQRRGVQMIPGVTYRGVDDQGLHIAVNDAIELLRVDQVVLCAGQVPNRDLAAPLQEIGMRVHTIGGAEHAGELDAKRAIEQGTRLGATL
jgi:2,4-dienoyl-CoA reductase (NADPH2)